MRRSIPWDASKIIPWPDPDGPGIIMENTMNVPGTNSGHGHVWKRPDGIVARCGGPGLCRECREDKERVVAVAADIQTVYLAAVDEKAAIMKELEDVPGANALEKVKRLKAWYQNLFIELSNSRPGIW